LGRIVVPLRSALADATDVDSYNAIAGGLQERSEIAILSTQIAHAWNGDDKRATSCRIIESKPPGW
jgi:hypothetical protein